MKMNHEECQTAIITLLHSPGGCPGALADIIIWLITSAKEIIDINYYVFIAFVRLSVTR